MKSQTKMCIIYNYAQHYRSSIFQSIDENFNCDFVFGDRYLDIKKMDYTLLKNKVTEVKNLHILGGYYQKGVVKLLFKKYNTYLLLGEVKCFSTWIFALLSCFIPHKKVYFWSHGLLSDKNKLKTLIYKLFFSLPDGAFIYNNRSRELLIEHGISSSRLHTIYNSLSYDTQLEIRNRLKNNEIYVNHFKNENKTLLFIGRLTKVKRLDLLIEALYKLRNKGICYNLVLIGDGEARISLQQLVERKNLTNQVWFKGASYDEIANAESIYNADMCVSPGNVGLTAIHSLMFGCPVITNDDFDTQMPEYESIKEGETGTYFIKDDVDDLANKIILWFNHEYSREQIRKKCFQEIDSYWNPKNQIKILQNVLKF